MGIWDNARAKKESNDALVKKMKDGKVLFNGIVKYAGGHKDIPKACDGNLVITEHGLFFRPGLTQVMHIPITDITKVEHLDDTQISKDVTLTRLLLVGIFAFGLKKKRKEEHHFVVINHIDLGMENKLIFEHKKAPQCVAAIMQAKQIGGLSINTLSITGVNEVSDGTDIPDQIRKLAALKEDGILTDDEFQNKKAELLAKM